MSARLFRIAETVARRIRQNNEPVVALAAIAASDRPEVCRLLASEFGISNLPREELAADDNPLAEFEVDDRTAPYRATADQNGDLKLVRERIVRESALSAQTGISRRLASGDAAGSVDCSTAELSATSDSISPVNVAVDARSTTDGCVSGCQISVETRAAGIIELGEIAIDIDLRIAG